MVQLGGFGSAPARAALRRPAAARRGGARARVRAEARADGRAARRARQAAARADAARDPAPAPAARRDDGLRHARPGRGADDVGPHRGVPPRQDPAARRAGAALRDTRRTPSSPGSSARTTASTARLETGRRRPLHRSGCAGDASHRRLRWPSRCQPASAVTVSLRPERVQIRAAGHTIDAHRRLSASRARCAKSSTSATTSGRASRCRATTISW